MLFEMKIIRKNNIRFDENLFTFEDVKFNFEYLHYVDNLFFLNEPIYQHFLHENFTSLTLSMYESPGNLFGYPKALEKVGNFLESCNYKDSLKNELGHAYAVYSIIQLIRLCGNLNKDNHDIIYSFIDDYIRDPIMKTNLSFYEPTKGDSRIIPILIRFKLTRLLIRFCNKKAMRRYNT